MLDRNTRRATIFAFLGLAVFVIALIGAKLVSPWLLVLAPVGWLTVVVALWSLSSSALFCPWCKKTLGRLTMGGKSFDDSVLCCPHCGHHLDDELPKERPENGI